MARSPFPPRRQLARKSPLAPRQPAERQYWMGLVAVGAMLFYAAFALGNLLTPTLQIAFNDLASTLAALTVAALAYRAARAQSERARRISWLYIAGSLLAWAVGDALWAWLELMRGVPPITPSLADLGYAAVLPLFMAGVLLRSARRPRTLPRHLLLLDAGMAVSALLAVGWALVIGPLLATLSADQPLRLLALAYPVADLCILGCLLIVLLREADDGPGALTLLAALVVLTVSDLVSAGLVLLNAYTTGHPVDVARFGALTLFGLAAAREHVDLGTREVLSPAVAPAVRVTSRAAVRVTRRVPSLRVAVPDDRAASRSPVWRYLTPAVLLALATLAVLVVSIQRGAPLDGPAEALLGLSWLLLLIRVWLGFQRAAEGHQRERRLRVGHATSFRREQQRRRQLEAVRDVTTELTRELDLTALLTLITRRTASLVDAPIGTVFLWDEATERLIPRAWHGLGSWFAELQPQRGEGAAGRAVELGHGVIINDYPAARERFAPALQRAPVEAALAAPIVSQGRLLGVIAAADERVGRRFDEDDLRLLELFADQAAVAIEHARLVDEAASVEALRELSRLKTELLSTVSHELRTPLTLIHGYAELLHVRADGLSPADVKMMAEEVLLGSRTMIRLVDDLLDFSRLDSTRLRLELMRVELAELLFHHVRAWRGQPGGERLHLETDAPLETYADLARLDQVIRNLISNALTHAPEGPITVRARQEDDWVRLEVEDRGPGIPEEELPRIWESFYRGERARKSPNRGSGLGLAVVRQLVELHQGRVEVSSQVDVGTTFRVWLPSAPPKGRLAQAEPPALDNAERGGSTPARMVSRPEAGVIDFPQRSEGE